MKLTEAQRRALEVVQRGNVIWNGLNCSYTLMRRDPAREDVIRRLVAKGFAEPDPALDPERVPVRFVVLTGSGLAALQEARG